MSANEIHVGDVGTVLTVTVKDDTAVVNISSATTKQIILRKPSSSKLEKVGVFVTDGADGQMKYTTVSGDLGESGDWSVQAKVVLTSGTWYSDTSTFTVHPNL